MYTNPTLIDPKIAIGNTRQGKSLQMEAIARVGSHRPDMSHGDDRPLSPSGNLHEPELTPPGRRPWGGVWYGLLIGLPLLHMATLRAGQPENNPPSSGGSVEAKEAEKVGGSAEAGSPTRSAPGRSLRRLPRFFGKLDLAADQRERIFKIQEQYQQEMERLELELAELRLERESQVRQVLSEEQRTRLDRFMEEPRTPVHQKESHPSANESDPKPSVATSASTAEMS